MNGFSAENTTMASRIVDAFGPVVELQDDNGKSLYYQVEKEFDVSGCGSYAVLRPDTDKPSEEQEIFKVVSSDDGSLSLETIDNDDEWEDVFELYDELTFPE